MLTSVPSKKQAHLSMDVAYPCKAFELATVPVRWVTMLCDDRWFVGLKWSWLVVRIIDTYEMASFLPFTIVT